MWILNYMCASIYMYGMGRLHGLAEGVDGWVSE